MPVDIPNYSILEPLGVGAQTRIYRAREMRTGKDYAVKIVKVRTPEDNNFIELMKAEHAIGTAIDHPSVRKVYELRMIRRRLRLTGAILFMEYVDGKAMNDKDFHRPLDGLLELFELVAAGLHAMHRAGFVHADLKPSNLLVTADDQVKIIDLGQSAKIHEAKTRIQGTIDYMAPEQAQRAKLDARTDVFGLGAAIHRILTGKPIATEMNQTAHIHAQGLIGKRKSQVGQDASHELPQSIAKLLRDCCHTEPDERIADMPTLIDRLRMVRTVLNKSAVTASVDEESAKFYDELDDTLFDEEAVSDFDLDLELDDE